jgi:hypothetical protein
VVWCAVPRGVCARGKHGNIWSLSPGGSLLLHSAMRLPLLITSWALCHMITALLRWLGQQLLRVHTADVAGRVQG